MDDFLEFIFELLFEIFAGVAEALVPENSSKKKRVALTVLSVLIGIVCCFCLIIGAGLFISSEDRLLGIFLFSIGLFYVAGSTAFFMKNKKKSSDRTKNLQPITDKISGSEVYPIYIQHRYRRFLTLSYFTEDNDEIIHSDRCLLYFSNEEKMRDFCGEHGLKLIEEGESYTFDFDETISDPIDLNAVLSNWNLLHTMARSIGMEFAGDTEAYSELYDLLLSRGEEENFEKNCTIGESNVEKIKNVFMNAVVYCNSFEIYR